jgi:uncharacterized protein (DUF2336 family)
MNHWAFQWQVEESHPWKAAMEPGPAERRRAAALADATRQFCALSRPTAGEIEAYKDLFYELIASCDLATRRQLSAALASSAYAPRAAAIFLASDDITVATPVLLFSTALNEAHIARLAPRLPHSHLLVLCRRGDLSEASMRALASAGGEQCRRQLENNPLARAVAGTIFPMEQEKPAPAARPAASIAAAARESVGGGRTPLSLDQRLLLLAGRGGRIPQKQPIRERAAAIDRAIPFERRLVLAARAKDKGALHRLIGESAGCPAELVARLAAHEGAGALAVLLKGLAVDGVTAMQTLLLAMPETGADRERFRALSATYARLDPAESREFIAMLAGMTRAGAPAGHADPETAFAAAAQARRSANSRPPREVAGERPPEFRPALATRKSA